MINAQEALSIILENVSPLGTITVSLERCRGFVLAQTVVANENVPPFDNAGMDGYAVRAEDVKSVPVTLKIIGEIPAGVVASKPLQKGEAYRILTGAKIPDGCDAVVQQEWTEKKNEQEITIVRSVQASHNIRPAGADIKKGSVVLEQGTRFRAQEIGLLASLGKQFGQIVRPPRVAVLATGNELVELGYVK
jgi:molybdopterin molybdotransferase